ncbi:MAG: sugar MFS transporter [Desulfovibrio sp.]|nr:sugar MFS transporter [Desulfovibrio sp.]
MTGKSEDIHYGLGPFIILTFIYFIVGFLTTINGQFQGPMQVAFLAHADKLRNTLTTCISFFFFLGYLLNSGVASRWVDTRGYKTTLVRALAIMVIGLLTYSLAAWIGANWLEAGLRIGQDQVPWAYFIFLLGCFFMGTSAAMLQVVINPYIASWEMPGTSAVQRMNMATGINSVGTTIGPFFVTAVIFAGVALTSVKPDQLLWPILWIAFVVACVMLVTMRLPLPDLAAMRSAVKLPRSVWSFSHLAFGVLAIFVYVGAEVSIGVNINMNAMQLLESGRELSFFGSKSLAIGSINLGIPALLATLYWGGMMVGRLISSAFPSVSPRALLIGATSIASVLIVLSMCLDNLYLLSAAGLFHSVMWSCIFTLAVAGLGAYTSRASGIFMMGVFGGAVFPLLQGMLADYLGSWRWTWCLALACELLMLVYGLWGSRVKDPEALANLVVPEDPGS